MHPNPVCMGLSLLLRVLEYGVLAVGHTRPWRNRGGWSLPAVLFHPVCAVSFCMLRHAQLGVPVPELGGTVRYPASGACPGIHQTDVLARGGTKHRPFRMWCMPRHHNPVHPSPRCLSDRTAAGELREFHDSWLFSRVLRGRTVQFGAPADNLPTETLKFHGC